MLNVSACPSASVAVGVNWYALPATTVLALAGGVPRMAGGVLAAPLSPEGTLTGTATSTTGSERADHDQDGKPAIPQQ